MPIDFRDSFYLQHGKCSLCCKPHRSKEIRKETKWAFESGEGILAAKCLRHPAKKNVFGSLPNFCCPGKEIRFE